MGIQSTRQKLGRKMLRVKTDCFTLHRFRDRELVYVDLLACLP
jgi:hypothetical protein